MRATSRKFANENRLPSPRIVRDGHHDERNPLGSLHIEEALKGGNVDIALERHVALRVVGLGNGEVNRTSPVVEYVRLGGVEMHVVGDDGSRPTQG